ncbi:hypothetical protein EVAR_57620_1 [Eumeta japonica]|uniref:Uncharacterized protein n=1 Tax=Eumeta variegata TaxID=151549 RepID=A0A4C1XZZ4_EUMVA|nr:hypothetical protein EVAR_57620_1 [Eumeta japonica]
MEYRSCNQKYVCAIKHNLPSPAHFFLYQISFLPQEAGALATPLDSRLSMDGGHNARETGSRSTGIRNALHVYEVRIPMARGLPPRKGACKINGGTHRKLYIQRNDASGSPLYLA